MALGTGSLRGEINERYSAALAVTQDGSVVSADSNQYMWASQAKIQCGIALGFLKSGTKDPVSIGKCVDAHLRMQNVPMAPVLPRTPDAICDQTIAGLVFFEWDSAIPPVDAVIANVSGCQWSGLVVTGHTDRSGSDAYNARLSEDRAYAVAQMLEGRGLSRAQMLVTGRGESENRVPTEDGVRELQNRRVEITVQTPGRE
jgi:hypothetical protein